MLALLIALSPLLDLDSTFVEGRTRAIADTVRMRDALGSQGGLEVETWVQTHAADLVTELTESAIEWQETLPPRCPVSTCACTATTPRAPILLSRTVCGKRRPDAMAAAKLLTHEVVHHFGITDEGFADAVAIAVNPPMPEAVLVRTEPGSHVTWSQTEAATVSAPAASKFSAALSLRAPDRAPAKPDVAAGVSLGYRLNGSLEAQGSYRTATVNYIRTQEYYGWTYREDRELHYRSLGVSLAYRPDTTGFTPIAAVGIAHDLLDATYTGDGRRAFSTDFFHVEATAGIRLPLAGKLAAQLSAVYAKPLQSIGLDELKDDEALPRFSAETGLSCSL